MTKLTLVMIFYVKSASLTNKIYSIIRMILKYRLPVNFNSGQEVTYKLCSCLRSLIKSILIIHFSVAITCISPNHTVLWQWLY